jgi:hypothetical protein
MKDKSLGILLIGIFGLTGLGAVALGWLLPWLQSERVTATLAGLAGIMIAGIQAFLLLKAPSRKRIPVIDFNLGLEGDPTESRKQ